MEDIKNIVKDFLENLEKKQKDSKIDIIVRTWENYADKKTQKHSKPLWIKNKELLIIVDSAPWKYELISRENAILSCFQQAGLKVNKIRFKVGSIK